MVELCRGASSQHPVKVRDVAVILGKFAWATWAIPFAQAHYRQLQPWYIETGKHEFTALAGVCPTTQIAYQ